MVTHLKVTEHQNIIMPPKPRGRGRGLSKPESDSQQSPGNRGRGSSYQSPAIGHNQRSPDAGSMGHATVDYSKLPPGFTSHDFPTPPNLLELPRRGPPPGFTPPRQLSASSSEGSPKPAWGMTPSPSESSPSPAASPLSPVATISKSRPTYTPLPIEQQVGKHITPKGLSASFPQQRVGTIGRRIQLFANFFPVDIPHGSVYHYDVEIHIVLKNGQTKVLESKSSPLRRKIIAQLLSSENGQELFETFMPAYDGNKNIITRNPLPISKSLKIKVTIVEDGIDKDFFVIIKPAKKDSYNCEINLEPLHEAAGGRCSYIPMECIMALDIVFRHGPSLKYVPVGRSFYQTPGSPEEVPLGEGKEIWYGYHQSLRPGWKPLPSSTRYFLNIDKTATAFLSEVPVLDFLLKVLHLSKLPPYLTDFQIKTLKEKLKNFKVQVTHQKYPRKYKVTGITRDRASMISFEKDGKKITLPEYFLETYQYRLKYPNYPCIESGNDKSKLPARLPLEVCKIVPGQPARGKLDADQQSIMVNKTAIRAPNRLQECIAGAHKVREASLEVLKVFDIEISTDPVRFDGRVLPPPQVVYSNEQKVSVRNGQWEMRGKQFIKRKDEISWAMISFSPCTENEMSIFANKLKTSAQSCGMRMELQAKPKLYQAVGNENDVKGIFQELKHQCENLDLVVVVLTKSSALYKTLKTVCETDLGIVTQGITNLNVRKCRDDRFSMRFLLNVCQKINAKMGGANTSLSREEKPIIFNRPIMIVGADVTHPAPTDKEKFSIAAAVASMDSGPSRYTSTVQVQKEKGEVRAREETILNLKEMIKLLLRDFKNNTGGRFKPEVILYYRDGVSEGQFQNVCDSELLQIRQACTELEVGYEPKITFIVVQKRHHTRFFPQNFEQDGVGTPRNVPAGTTVDTDITSPSHFNFYLCSHVAIQGTSRPGHYNILYDDSNFDADTLQKLTFYLCHTYARCTKSISIPPPVMYADLAAYRAKVYIDQLKQGRLSSSESSSDDSNTIPLSEDVVNAILLKENIRKTMYFV